MTSSSRETSFPHTRGTGRTLLDRRVASLPATLSGLSARWHQREPCKAGCQGAGGRRRSGWRRNAVNRLRGGRGDKPFVACARANEERALEQRRLEPSFSSSARTRLHEPALVQDQDQVDGEDRGYALPVLTSRADRETLCTGSGHANWRSRRVRPLPKEVSIARRGGSMMRKLSLVVALVLAGSISGIIAAQADSGSQSFLYFA